MCEQFAAAGYRVVGCARSGDAIAKLQSQLSGCSFSVVDIADADAVTAWANKVIAEFGPPDLLVNNAGVINRSANLWQISAEEFQAICQINLGGTHATIRAFLPAMIKRGTGGIVNFSSTWGQSTSPQVAPYCATKWGIEGLTQALAQELTGELFTVALNPGVINTDMLVSCFGASAATYPSPEEWADQAVPFILNLGPRDNGQSLRAP